MAALRPGYIAEHKPRSPFGWVGPDIPVEDFIGLHTDAGAYAVHVQEPWGGSWDTLARARAVTDKSVLVKGVLSEREVGRVVASGAVALLIEGQNDHLPVRLPVIEVTTPEALGRALQREPAWIVVNARDIDTGEMHPERHDEMRSLIPEGVGAIAASGLVEPRADYDLSLIGTALMEACGVA